MCCLNGQVEEMKDTQAEVLRKKEQPLLLHYDILSSPWGRKCIRVGSNCVNILSYLSLHLLQNKLE